MNATPKQRFHEHKAQAQQFLDIVDSEVFTRATELAMLALVDETASLEARLGPDCYHQLLGARRFLAILKNLPEPPAMPAARTNYNLQHDIK